MLKIINTICPALIFATFATSAPGTATAGRFCGPQVKSGEASGPTEEEAKKAATVWWSSRAGALGKVYENWDDAQDKSVNCHPDPRNTFKCVAVGKPCLPDGVLPDNAPKQDL
jgi:hypothetical protein